MSVVDVHTHFVPAFVFAALAAGDARHGLAGDAEFLSSPAGRLPLHYPEMRDPAEKLAAMDARGVDESVVSLTPHLFIYGEEHEPVEFGEIVTLQGMPTQKVHLIGPDGRPVTALYPMSRQADGSWRIEGCYLQAPEEHQA